MKWAKWFLVYLNILTQSIAITDSMFNFGNFLTKKRYNFWSQRDRKKKKISRWHEILLRIQSCHKKCQNRKKKNQLCVDKRYNVWPMYLKWNIKIKTQITDIYCTIFAITNIVYHLMLYKHYFRQVLKQSLNGVMVKCEVKKWLKYNAIFTCFRHHVQ